MTDSETPFCCFKESIFVRKVLPVLCNCTPNKSNISRCIFSTVAISVDDAFFSDVWGVGWDGDIVELSWGEIASTATSERISSQCF